MKTLALRWLVGGLLLVGLAWGCGSGPKKADSTSAQKGVATVDEEAYVLPPLSEFEAFPQNIADDLRAKCAAQGFVLEELKRTKGARRQSILARFGGASDGMPPQTEVLAMLRLLGTNFANVARIVLEFPGPGAPAYVVANGHKVEEYLGPRSGEASVDEFWQTLEFEVTPEEAPIPAESTSQVPSAPPVS